MGEEEEEEEEVSGSARKAGLNVEAGCGHFEHVCVCQFLCTAREFAQLERDSVNLQSCSRAPSLVQMTSWSITHRSLLPQRRKLQAAMFSAYSGCSLADCTSEDESISWCYSFVEC